MRADGSLQSVGTRGLPTPAPLPPSQLCARRGLPAPRTGPTRPGHVAALGSSGPGPALGALMVCWSGPTAPGPRGSPQPRLPACVRPGVRGWSAGSQRTRRAVSASCNTLLTRNRIPTVTASRKRLGRGPPRSGPFPAGRPAGGLPGRGPLVPLSPGQGPAVSPGAGGERCGEGRVRGEEVGAVAWAVAQCGHPSLRRGPTWPRSF